VIRLRVLGALDLHAPDGEALRNVLAQPRRAALLVYLALSAQGPRRRDALLAMFWPESDGQHARDSLNQALAFLRRSLGPNVIQSMGDDEVRIAEGRLWCDATALDEALTIGHVAEALDFYRGDLLDSFHISGAPDFDRWLEAERIRVRERLSKAMLALLATDKYSADLAQAESMARRCTALAPYDEIAQRQLIWILDKMGDRAEAIHTYEVFRTRLEAELGVEPAPETQALIAAISARDTAQPNHQGQGVADVPQTPPSQPGPDRVRGETEADGDAEQVIAFRRVRERTRRSALISGVIALLALSGAVASWIYAVRSRALVPARVAVAMFANQTSDSSLDWLGGVVTDWLSDGLQRIGGIEVVPARLTLAPRSPALGVRELADETSAAIVVTGGYVERNDSLLVRARVVDGKTGRLMRPLDEIGGRRSDVMQVVQAVRERVAGAVAQTFHASPHAAEGGTPPTFAAYLKYLEGFRLANEFRYAEAIPRLDDAVALDSNFLGAWFAKADAHYNFAALIGATLGFSDIGVTQQMAKGDSARQRLERARNHLSPAQRHYLDWQDATRQGDLGRSRRALRELVAVAPDPGARGLEALLDLRLDLPTEAMQSLEGSSAPSYFKAEAYHILKQHRAELVEARRLRDANPGLYQGLAAELMALAALGRTREITARLDESLTFAEHPGWWTYGSVAAIAGLELRAHGHTAAASEAFQRSIAWYRTKAEDGLRSDTYGLARTLYWSGQWKDSRELFARLNAEVPGDLDYVGYLGVSAARAGDRAEALRIDQRLAIFTRPFPLFGHPNLWRARIAATLGARDEAVGRLREAIGQGLLPLDVAQGWGYPMWVHHDVDFETLRDYPPFKALLDRKSTD
jgi:DNA-binding SARP family transcriptional activator/TolB-like protein